MFPLRLYDREGNVYNLDLRDPVDRRLAAWLQKPDYRRVGWDEVGEVHVSTALLPFDHAGDGPPVIFETMIFGGDLDGECWRYCTEAEAVAGHANALALVSLVLAATT